MNKAGLVLEVQKKLGEGISKVASERAVDAVLESIKRGIKKDKRVRLLGFGTFTVVKRPARLGVNPQTGKKMRIKAFKTVKFSAGDSLKSSV